MVRIGVQADHHGIGKKRCDLVVRAICLEERAVDRLLEILTEPADGFRGAQDRPDNATLVTSSAEGSTRLLLRFNGYLHNDGPGALDIRPSANSLP